jgi:hypothetical protein
MKNVLAVVLISLTTVAQACSFTPEEQIVGNAELIVRTKNIVLVKVVSVKVYKNGWDTTYTLQTIENLRGDMPPSFEIDGGAEMKGSEDFSFDNHTNAGFWKQDGHPGRAFVLPGGCRLYPRFVINSTYLVFYNPPYHLRSFELIADPQNDKWLKYVRAQLSHPNK